MPEYHKFYYYLHNGHFSVAWFCNSIPVLYKCWSMLTNRQACRRIGVADFPQQSIFSWIHKIRESILIGRLKAQDFQAGLLTSKQASKEVPACLLAKVSVENLRAMLVGLQSLKLACYSLVCLYDMIFFSYTCWVERSWTIQTTSAKICR